MSAGELVAVVDQGSTATKAALAEAGGGLSGEVTIAVGRRARADRVEQDPEELAASVESALSRLLAERPVAAIGLTCQRSTCLIWERRSGRPLTPALSWQDRSQTARVEALAGRHAEIARRTGLLASPHYAAPKLAALLEDLPDGRRRAAAGELVAGTLDAFLVRRLTGREATEPGQAGRTLLYGLDAGGWDPELRELFGIPAAALPELRDSAGEWGRYRGVPLTAVAGDQQAALLGHGGWEAGVTAAHFGTGAFVLAATGDRAVRHAGLLTAVLATTGGGRRFQLEGSVNSAGSAADWACRLTGQDLLDWETREFDPREVPWVLPAMAGVAAPWWRPRARTVTAGIGFETGPEELVAGVLTGVGMRVLDCVEEIGRAGVAVRVLRVSGKLTRLRGLVGLLADAGQVPVEVAADEETGLTGIARLAAAGLHGSDGPLAGPPAIRARRDPTWPEPRARQLRADWRAFVTRALDLPDRH